MTSTPVEYDKCTEEDRKKFYEQENYLQGDSDDYNYNRKNDWFPNMSRFNTESH